MSEMTRSATSSAPSPALEPGHSDIGPSDDRPASVASDFPGSLQHLYSQRARLEYRLYLPRTRRSGELPLMIAVHGISRNVEEHAACFLPWAERLGFGLVVPTFAPDAFPDYQRLGRRGRRSDLALLDLVGELGEAIGPLESKLRLFGFSGGGQFVHRFTMAYPERVAAQVVAAAGWYTFPDRSQRYPAGLRASRSALDLHMRPSAFLSVPTAVLVGEWDVCRDPELRRTRLIDSGQGTTRLERGFRWLHAMRSAAAQRGLKTELRFHVLPQCDHDFERCVAAGALARMTCELLFESVGRRRT